ncbi:MAG TPA: MBL fold metallo-hydrolase [Anaerolineales bacterium]|nr:MBL fold metallo-hydrolase [Anaerolineales bacterium]
MQIHDLEIHLVSDGVVHVDPGGPFGLVPRGLYQKIFPPGEDNLVPMSLTCLLVRSRGKTILVDTGLGERLTPEEVHRWQLDRPGGGLIAGLAALGVAPDDVDVVINTHLHADHCSGNTRLEAGEVQPSFPRATYLVQRIEWAEAVHTDARTQGTYFADNFQPLLRAGRMRLLHGNESITDQVRCVVTPGHTRGHQSVVLETGDWSGLYLADLASYAVHFERLAWMTAYDAAPLETLRTKAQWQAWAADRQAWLFFEHDLKMPVGRLERKGNGYRLAAEAKAEPLTSALPTPRPLPE